MQRGAACLNFQVPILFEEIMFIGFNSKKVRWLIKKSCWRSLLVKESSGFSLDRKAWNISSGTRPCFLLASGFCTLCVNQNNANHS
jgi:hypothetical protein